MSKCSAPNRVPGKLDASNSNRTLSVRFCPPACRTRPPTGAMLRICVEPSFSWARFWLWRNFCSGVGLVNQFRTVKKWFPNLWLFSGPKNGRTKRAPIMGAQLVLSKMGPKHDPTFRGPTQKKTGPAFEVFITRDLLYFPGVPPGHRTDPSINQGFRKPTTRWGM